ncbi:hypothetical protein RCL1_000079 [Eukaryota sp. TZLM3-RCL]
MHLIILLFILALCSCQEGSFPHPPKIPSLPQWKSIETPPPYDLLRVRRFYLPLMPSLRLNLVARNWFYGSPFSLSMTKGPKQPSPTINMEPFQYPIGVGTDWSYNQGILFGNPWSLALILITLLLSTFYIVHLTTKFLSINYCYFCFRLPRKKKFPTASSSVFLLIVSSFFIVFLLILIGNNTAFRLAIDELEPKVSDLFSLMFDRYTAAVTRGIEETNSLRSDLESLNETLYDIDYRLNQWSSHLEEVSTLKQGVTELSSSVSSLIANGLYYNEFLLLSMLVVPVLFGLFSSASQLLNPKSVFAVRKWYIYFPLISFLLFFALSSSLLSQVSSSSALFLNDWSKFTENEQLMTTYYGAIGTAAFATLHCNQPLTNNFTTISDLQTMFLDRLLVSDHPSVIRYHQRMTNIVASFLECRHYVERAETLQEYLASSFHKTLTSFSTSAFISSLLSLFFYVALLWFNGSTRKFPEPEFQLMTMAPQFCNDLPTAVDPELLEEARQIEMKREKRAVSKASSSRFRRRQ